LILIFLTDSCGFPKNLTITLRHFKNIKNNQPVTITLITNAQEPNEIMIWVSKFKDGQANPDPILNDKQA
jgi:phage tail sheath gpL-like